VFHGIWVLLKAIDFTFIATMDSLSMLDWLNKLLPLVSRSFSRFENAFYVMFGFLWKPPNSGFFFLGDDNWEPDCANIKLLS